MSNRNLRVIFILSVITAILMLATQLYWVKSSYEVERKIFDSKVKEALNRVAGGLLRANENYSPYSDLAKKESELFFTVEIGELINPIALEELLIREFGNLSINTDFQYAIYSCDDMEMNTSRFVYMSGERKGDTKDVVKGFPLSHSERNYFAVQFPHRNVFLSKEM